MMPGHMKRNDYIILVAALVVPFIGGWLTRGIESVEMMGQITLYLGVGATIAAFLGLIAIYRGRSQYGGRFARNLETIGIGLGLFTISWVPHIFWHLMGIAKQPPEPLGPAWAIFGKPWWTGFFHVGTIMFFLMAAYGFYLFWDMSRE